MDSNNQPDNKTGLREGRNHHSLTSNTQPKERKL